jgi:succinoglycan biosynthesis protein ExoV
MQLFAYRGSHPNFGDELNHWLWDRLLPGFFDDDPQDLFLGIGSILFDNFDPTIRKIVFGSGYGGYTDPPRIDDKWKFYFVRGKKTAEAVGVPQDMAVGDSGILIRSCWNAADIPKKHDVSFMPHYESAIRGNWDIVCRRAGINYIDPRESVETVLTEMSASRLIVSEAMHGVIIADALRVPWRAIRPIDVANRAKWYDWASPLDVSIDFETIGPSNIVEMVTGWLGWNDKLRKSVAFRHRWIKEKTRNFVFDSAARHLRRCAALPGQLSSDAAIERAHAEMLVQLERLKADYPERIAGRRA